MFTGSITALITPFKDKNAQSVDYSCLEALIERQISSGTHGIVPCGTTGESPTLSSEEHNQVIAQTVKFVNGRIKVLAGTGSNSTLEAIEYTLEAQKAGADGALIMTPYYNKPSQEGLFQHFKAIHDATEIPIVLYNIPGRSVVDIKDETIARIAQLPRIVGIKDATGDLSRPTSLKKLITRPDFEMISGEDATAVDFNRLGGVGCISVTSNIAPALCAQMQNLCLEGKFDEADAINAKLMAVHDAMFCESSPQPAKYAAKLLGKCDGQLRLPLVEISAESKKKVETALANAALI